MFTRVLEINSSISINEDRLREIDDFSNKTEFSLEKISFYMYRHASIRF